MNLQPARKCPVVFISCNRKVFSTLGWPPLGPVPLHGGLSLSVHQPGALSQSEAALTSSQLLLLVLGVAGGLFAPGRTDQRTGRSGLAGVRGVRGVGQRRAEEPEDEDSSAAVAVASLRCAELPQVSSGRRALKKENSKEMLFGVLVGFFESK